MLRICKYCGREYNGVSTSTACSECSRKLKQSTVRERTCRQCGISFQGGPRAFYCPTCRKERMKQHNRESSQRRKSGKARKLGSTAVCEICGGEYTVVGSLQRYCPDCAPEAVKAADREQGLKWYHENVDTAERQEERKAHAAEINCVICGKPFIPTTVTLCCSTECRKELAKRNQADFAARNRESLNVYQKKLAKEKMQNMSAEELAEYRAKINARARENYMKRKEKRQATDTGVTDS